MESNKTPLRVGIGGPVGSGKTALCEMLCKAMRDHYEMAVITNDIYTREDMERGGCWQGPGQITAKGVLEPVPPELEEQCWALSDGATLYPRSVFDSGLRFFDEPRFGDVYKEFGCLLQALGFRIRPLRQTGVLHHLQEMGRSYQPTIDETAAKVFAMMMFSFVYQRTSRHMVETASQVMRMAGQSPRQSPLWLKRAYGWARHRTADYRRWENTRLSTST